jgi:hypothetical protein
MVEMTKEKFGFHSGGGKHEPGPVTAYVQICVKSSALSRAPDLAISAPLTTEAEISGFKLSCFPKPLASASCGHRTAAWASAAKKL